MADTETPSSEIAAPDPREDTVELIITRSDHPAPIPFSVNGIDIPLPVGTPFDFPVAFLTALEVVDGIEWRRTSEPGPGAQTPAEVRASLNSETFPEFDPEAIIQGNLDDVLPLIEQMTPAQLMSLRSAEDDREKPRKTLTDAINKAIAAASE